MDLGSEKTFKLIEYILAKKRFGQRLASKETKVSLGQVNKVIAWLSMKNFLKKESNAYVVSDAAGIVSAISFFRHMEELKISSLKLKLDKKKILKMLPKSSILCMESALDFYSPTYVGNRVCIYADEKTAEEIEKKFRGYEGNVAELVIYKPAPEIKKMKKGGFFITPEVRTVIDLVCDDKAFAADALFKKLWGAKFG
jgi:hypothetical protein